VYIVYLAIADIGNILIKIDEISLTVILSDGPDPDVDDTAFASAVTSFAAAQTSHSVGDLWDSTYRAPDKVNFDTNEYAAYIAGSNWDGLNTSEIDAQIAIAESYNGVTDDRTSDRLAAFIRLYCQVSVLIFATISVG